MRKLWWSIRKRLIRLDPSPRVVRRLGAVWELDPNDWIDIRLLMGQPFEDAQLARFTGLLAAHKATHFLDCGANIGLYTVLIGQRFPDLALHAFEPVTATRDRLRRNLALNGLEERAEIHGIALSASRGEAEIAVDPRSTGVATLSDDEAGLTRRGFSRTETVPLAPLSDILPLTGARPAIKLDVEGHELDALAGMTGLLEANACLCQIETRPRHRAEVIALMEAAGYGMIDEIDADLYFRPRAEGTA